MSFFSIPFSFDKLIAKEDDVAHETLEESVHTNLRFLILTRVGEFEYDEKMGFGIWEYDKHLYYSDKAPYWSPKKEDKSRKLHSSGVNQNFTQALNDLIAENEPRLKEFEAKFEFKKGEGMSDYQRYIEITVNGSLRKNNKPIKEFKMQVLYSPFNIKFIKD